MQLTSTARQALERLVVQNLIDGALAAGWTVPSVDDGGDDRVKCATSKDVMDAVFSVDDSVIHFRKPTSGRHSAVIVLGNGLDCVSDHSVGDAFQREVIGPSNAFIESLESEGAAGLYALEREKSQQLLEALDWLLNDAQAERGRHTAITFSHEVIANIQQQETIQRLAEDGKIALVESGCDCNGLEYSGRVHIIDATLKAVNALRASVAKKASGQFKLVLASICEANLIKYQARDLATEARENGQPCYSIASQFQ